ncbi:MAG: hypothetical protein DME65_06080, partial [Verrucomicrobia bacterium]
MCANEGSAATSDSQKIITAAGCLLWAKFRPKGQVVFRPGLFFLRISYVRGAKHMRVGLRHLFIFSFS